MKIDSETFDKLQNDARVSAGQADGRQTRVSKADSSRGATDVVNLSSARSFVSLAKSIAPADRQAKLNSLAAQLRSGQYHPDLNEVSRSLIDSHLGQ